MRQRLFPIVLRASLPSCLSKVSPLALVVLMLGMALLGRFGFGEAGQVVEIAVLPVRIVAVVVAHPLWRGGDDADAVAADDAHQLLAATGEFPGFNHDAPVQTRLLPGAF